MNLPQQMDNLQTQLQQLNGQMQMVTAMEIIQLEGCMTNSRKTQLNGLMMTVMD